MSTDVEDLPNLEEIIALMPGNIYWKNRQGIRILAVIKMRVSWSI